MGIKYYTSPKKRDWCCLEKSGKNLAINQMCLKLEYIEKHNDK